MGKLTNGCKHECSRATNVPLHKRVGGGGSGGGYGGINGDGRRLDLGW